MARKFGFGLIFAAAIGLVTGCQQNTNMGDMMKAPARPTELDRLNDFVGQWESTWQCTMPGSDKPMTCTSSSTANWEADRWVLVERMQGRMGEDPMSGLCIWTWDAEGKVYRTWWYDNHGQAEEGTATYDTATNTWNMKSKNGSGTFKHTGNGVYEMTMKETTGGLFPSTVMEMKGTSRKVK